MNEGPGTEYYTEILPDGRTAMFRGPRPANPPGKFPRAAQARWDAENLATLSTKVKVETAARFRAVCERMNMTPYAMLKEYVIRTAGKARKGGGS